MQTWADAHATVHAVATCKRSLPPTLSTSGFCPDLLSRMPRRISKTREISSLRSRLVARSSSTRFATLPVSFSRLCWWRIKMSTLGIGFAICQTLSFACLVGGTCTEVVNASPALHRRLDFIRGTARLGAWGSAAGHAAATPGLATRAFEGIAGVEFVEASAGGVRSVPGMLSALRW